MVFNTRFLAGLVSSSILQELRNILSYIIISMSIIMWLQLIFNYAPYYVISDFWHYLLYFS